MDEVVVETRYGTIQGTQEGPLQVFRGIPFAKPPIGPLRFRSLQRCPERLSHLLLG